MKNIITILIISFLASSFTFKNEQPVGDSNSYHVMALSGLKMRDLPSLKGKKILTIPYNGEVEVIATGFGALKVKELEDFYIEGEWVQVSYNGKEGYVFDGYLTQFPVPDENVKMDYDKYDSKFEYYFNTKLIQKGDKFNLIKHNWECKNENGCFCGYSKEYEQGLFYSYRSCDEKNSIEIIEIDNISMSEAYFILRALELNKYDNSDYNPKIIRTYDNNKNIIREEPDGAGCWSSIRQRKSNSIEIETSCGC